MAEIKNIYAWIGPDNGYAAIYWQADGSQDYDWVGLYADEQKEQNDYDSWQWVSEDSSYVTSTIISDKLNVRYLTWDEKSGNIMIDDVGFRLLIIERGSFDNQKAKNRHSCIVWEL